MDTKIEIKEEDPLLDNVVSQNESNFFTRKTNSDAVFLDNGCEVIVKTENKYEYNFPEFCSQKEKQSFAKHLIKEIDSENVMCRNNCEMDTKIEIGSQNQEEFLAEDPSKEVKKYNSACEMDKIEIKEEPWWPEGQTSFVCDDIMDEDFTSIKLPRLCTEAVPGDSTEDSRVLSDDALGKNRYINFGKNCLEYESKESDITNISPVEKHVVSEQSDKCSISAEIYSKTLLIHKGKTPHICEICNKSFTQLSNLKRHNLIHQVQQSHKCEICEKTFTRLSYLKKHKLRHENKKSHKCEICEKTFSHSSYLKKHKLIHEDKKPHSCEICEKAFTHLYSLKSHYFTHQDNKPHKCDVCEKTFTHLSYLKSHHLIHEGKRPHKCETCEKTFTYLSSLKSHYLTHQDEKPHKCETCEKTFTHLSSLKFHRLIHQDKKPHKCDICEKSFTHMSYLKSHVLIHQGKKPYKCEICEKTFTHLNSLKLHNWIHEVKSLTGNL